MNLQDRADRIFSKFVRISAADHAGYVECFTCLTRMPWQEAQNGHWKRRGLGATRFHLDNTRPQCVACNEYRHGMPEAFEEGLRNDLGDERVDALVELSKTEAQFRDEDYREVIDMYGSILKKEYGIVM